MMARYIYKYQVPINGQTQLLLDEGVEILSVLLQYDEQYLEDVIVFYAYCTDGVPNGKPRTFEVFGTGHEIPENAVHRGSAKDGVYVWHLMELVYPVLRVESVRAE